MIGAFLQALLLGLVAFSITSRIDNQRVELEHELAGVRAYHARQIEATMSLISLVSRAKVHAQELIEVSQGPFVETAGLDPDESERLRAQRREHRERFNSFVQEWRVGKQVVGLSLGYYGIGNDPGDPIAGGPGSVSYEWAQLESAVDLYLGFAQQWYQEAPTLTPDEEGARRLQQEHLHDEIRYRLQTVAGKLLDQTIPEGLKEAHPDIVGI